MENKFTWREVTPKEKEIIRKDSKKLIEDFSKKLEKIKTKENHFSREEGYREEGMGWKTDKDFQEIMFANAPLLEDNSIVAEKGGWK